MRILRPDRAGTSPPTSTGVALALLILAAPLLLAGCPGTTGDGFGLLGDVELPDDGGGDPGDDPGGIGDAFELDLSASFVLAEVGQPIGPVTPITSEPVTSYTVSPPLPAGLGLDPSTGVLSGTPQERVGRTTFTLTATSANGTAEAELDIAVAGPARWAYVASADDSTVSILSVDPADGRLQNAGYLALNEFEVQPENLVLDPGGRYLFATNAATDTLAVLRADPISGRLESTHTVSIGQGPHHVAVHPSGPWVYVVSNSAAALRAFRLDQVAGTVQQIGTTLTTTSDPGSVMVAPNGRYLVLTHASTGQASSYTLDPNSGLPTLSSAITIFAGSEPQGGQIGAKSESVYITLSAFQNALRLAANPQTGSLQVGATRPTELDPSQLFLHPNGRFAYVLNGDSATSGTPSVSIYPIDAVSGALGAPVHAPLEFAASTLGFSPTGEDAYLLDPDSREAVRFDVDEVSGLLTEGAATRTRQGPVAVVLLDGDQPLALQPVNVYVVDGEFGELSVYSVSAQDGSLAQLGPAVPAGLSAVDVEVDPLRRYVWVLDDAPGKERLLAFAILAEGQLAPVGETLFGVRPTAMVPDPAGRFLFVATDATENHVFTLEVQDDGTLINTGFEEVGASPVDVRVDPTGQFLYVVNSGAEEADNQGDVSSFRIDPRTGALTAVTPNGLAGGAPQTLAFSPGADRAYSPFLNADSIAPYEVLPATGQLDIQLLSTTTGNEPIDLELGSTGRFAWSAVRDSAGAGRVELYDVRDSDGALYDAGTDALEAREVFSAGTNPIRLAVDPGERYVYVLGSTSGTVTTFAVDPTSGVLTQVDTDMTGLSPTEMALSIEAQ